MKHFLHLLPALAVLSSAALGQDFNDDGYRDLAIGAPGEDINGAADAGAVHVLYGSMNGLTGTSDQFLHQDADGIFDTAEPGDRFGSALAYGDFDSDGFDDLAVGVPYQDKAGKANAGMVQVFYGSATGLGTAKQQLLSLDDYNMSGPSAAGDQFGKALCSGDFNGDGRQDLAIGIPYDDVSGVTDAGSVRVVYGGGIFFNLDTGTAQSWSQANCGGGELLEAGDHFGWSLAAESFNGFDANGWRCEDLAIGVPDEDLNGVSNCGAVHVLAGSSTKLTSAGSQLWHQDHPNMIGGNDPGDNFGYSLAAGDFSSDGYFDLAIGAPYEKIYVAYDLNEPFTPLPSAGTVTVIYGSPAGLSGVGGDLVYQNAYAIQEESEAGDLFGFSLAAGTIDGDQHWDLVIGIPWESVGSVPAAGAVAVLFGSASGIKFTGNQLWHQDSSGILGVAEDADGFGFTVTCADFNADGRMDVAVGAYLEDVDGVLAAGSVSVLRGSNGGLTATGNQLWTQNSAGVEDSNEMSDTFGSALCQ
ncbi:MAG: hypothetical protein EYC70_11270 [Planctomycetota bacterium]|nr:MAG: hypothetical protein EYC70_11270 [Planctomycetota bacterium]